MSKINVLIHTVDSAGVAYFRSNSCSVKLQELYDEDFNIEINQQVNWNDLEYLKRFQIIHFHRTLCDFEQMHILVAVLRSNGIKLVMDIDDYWLLPPTHPAYDINANKKLANDIIGNLKLVDYVTTTTDYFANEIRKYNKNVVVLYNAADLESKNFKDQKTTSEKVRVGYLAGSSHLHDLQQLKGFVNVLRNSELKDKFQISLNGFDTRGMITNITLNEEFIKDMTARNIWTDRIIKHLKEINFDITQSKIIPADIIAKYGVNCLKRENKPITPKQSVWYEYEKAVFTDEYKLLSDKGYYNHLMEFVNEPYPNTIDQPYVRNWTLPVATYATRYNDIDISLAPLADNTFNRMKSNLKQIEAFSRKIAIICSDIPPYNVHGKHMKNCILVPAAKGDRGWTKAIKRLINEPNLRKDLGEQLYEDFKPVYSLDAVSKTRREFYLSIV